MTELLEQVITKLKTLPATEQDAIASMILEELEDEGINHFPVLQILLLNSQLWQWLSIMET